MGSRCSQLRPLKRQLLPYSTADWADFVAVLHVCGDAVEMELVGAFSSEQSLAAAGPHGAEANCTYLLKSRELKVRKWLLLDLACTNTQYIITEIHKSRATFEHFKDT
jgi:hypothetical protein